MYNGGIPLPGGGPQMRNNPNNKQPMRGLPMVVPDSGVQSGQMMSNMMNSNPNSNPYSQQQHQQHQLHQQPQQQQQQQQFQQYHLPPPTQQPTAAAAPSSSPFSFFGIGNSHHQQQQHHDPSQQQQQSTGTSFFSKITSIGVGGGTNPAANTATAAPGMTNTSQPAEGLLSKGKDLFKKFGLWWSILHHPTLSLPIVCLCVILQLFFLYTCSVISSIHCTRPSTTTPPPPPLFLPFLHQCHIAYTFTHYK